MYFSVQHVLNMNIIGKNERCIHAKVEMREGVKVFSAVTHKKFPTGTEKRAGEKKVSILHEFFI